MGTYSVTFDSEHGTASIHEGLSFDEALDVINEVVSEQHGLTPSLTNASSPITAKERELVASETANARRVQR